MVADADAEMDAERGYRLWATVADGHERFVGQVQGDGAQVVFAGFPDD